MIYLPFYIDRKFMTSREENKRDYITDTCRISLHVDVICGNIFCPLASISKSFI